MLTLLHSTIIKADGQIIKNILILLNNKIQHYINLSTDLTEQQINGTRYLTRKLTEKVKPQKS